MLKRNALQSYWLARYLARGQRMLLLLEELHELSHTPTCDARTLSWSTPLLMTGTHLPNQHADLNEMKVMEIMLADLHQVSSVLCCLQLARENAHALRGVLAADIWESINRTWLCAMAIPKNAWCGAEGVHNRAWLQQQYCHIIGTIDAQPLDNLRVSFHFGQRLEYADCAIRLFQACQPLNEAIDIWQWQALLGAVQVRAMAGLALDHRTVTHRILTDIQHQQSVLRCMEMAFMDANNLLPHTLKGVVSFQQSLRQLQAARQQAGYAWVESDFYHMQQGIQQLSNAFALYCLN